MTTIANKVEEMTVTVKWMSLVGYVMVWVTVFNIAS